MYLDDMARQDFKKAKQSVVGWILMASFQYYHKDTNLLADTTFDKMCKWLLDNYDTVEHRYKHLITRDQLQAGSLYDLGTHDYPIQLIRISERLVENHL